MLCNPQLPPKADYVEVLVKGVHMYKNVHTGKFVNPTEHTETTEEQVKKLQEENIRLKAQLELQLQQYSFLEDCILEMADIVYA